MTTGGKKRSPAKKRSRAKKKSQVRKRSKAGPRPDPSDTDDTDVRFIQPYQATKDYLCPGCGRTIVAGQGHMVAVPRYAPDLRRHWHRGCWVNRKTRY